MEPGRGHLAETSIHARASVVPTSSSVPSSVRRAVRAGRSAEGPHDVIADLLGKAPEARELGAGDEKKRRSGPSGTTLC
jgi:hypothetical protein